MKLQDKILVYKQVRALAKFPHTFHKPLSLA